MRREQGWLNFIPDNSVDLIYIDPPFFSNKNYEIVWGNSFEVRSFGDRFKGGIEHYIEWMRPKIREAKRILKDTSLIYLHCNRYANHHLRILLEDVFGTDNFRNEIIWHYHSGTYPQKDFKNKHDTIFRFSKTNDYIPNMLRIPRRIKKSRFNKIDKDGRKYHLDGHGTKFYEDTGKIPDDVWTYCENEKLTQLNSMSKERIGYKTQKPEVLIDRIIRSSTNEDDIVLDFFGGGGTTAKVCSDLNRRFIIGDVSPVAVRVTADRLSAHGYRNYEIKALPSTKKDYLDMNPHKFADMICELMGWKPSIKKSGDGGIDGFADKGNIPIQIKNHKNKTGRPDIQKFLGALNKYKIGFFVSWGFSPEAWEFKASVKNKKIEFIEVGKILNGLLISDDISTKHQKLYKQRVKKFFKEAIEVKESELQKEKEEFQKEKSKKIKKRRRIKKQ